MTLKKDCDNTTADVLSDSFLDGDFQSSMDYDLLDDVVYNSSSSFDISEIADLLLDNIDEYVFITDSNTKNIVYINKPLAKALGVSGSFVGTCHELLRGCDKPCKECNNNHAIDGKFYVTTIIESKLKDYNVTKSKNIELYNRMYTINVAMKKNCEISQNVLNNAGGLHLNDIVAPFTTIYTKNLKEPNVQLYRFIECLGIETNAKFCCIYEQKVLGDNDVEEHSHEDNFHRAHLWVREDSAHDQDSLEVPAEILNKAVAEQKSFSIKAENGTDEFFSFPLISDETFLGTVFIKDPAKDAIAVLEPAISTISGFMSSSLMHRIMHSELTNVENRDSLTKLKNRKSLLSDINSLAITHDIGVLYLNVNGLKQINSNLGIKNGDTILVKTASLLKQLLHNSEYIYRIGGDEFVGIYPNIEEHEFDMVSDMLKAFMTSDKGFSVSVGTSWVKSGVLIQSAINQAESDMYVEKKKYYRIHPDNNEQTARYRSQSDAVLNIIEPAKIQELIENNCFKVLYQPKFKIQGDVAKIAGAEALVRLIINGAVIPPDDFIPALESAHYTHLIDYFVFETICKKMRDRIDAGKVVLPVSCNFSRHTIVRPEFKSKLMEIMNRYKLNYNLIPLEVSEHTNTAKHKELVEVTEDLAKEGFNISIDDFGTAHANIYSLADLAVSEVKFDKKLIDNLSKKNNKKLTTILSVLITMCKKLGIKTIAEGVEDKEQSEILKKLGCDEIQGYYYSKPILSDDYYQKLN
ncbi:MAG: EAL domain-containing protein [Succinivibrio sp.]